MAYIALGLIIIGIILMMIEIFVPGFGVFGITGLLCMGGSAFITITSVENGIIIVVSVLVVLLVLGYAAIELAKKYGFYGKLILNDTLNTDQSKAEAMDFSNLIDAKGIVKTPLRPSGRVEFDGEIVEAYSDGEFIAVGQQVVAYKVYGDNLYVKKLQ